MITMILFQLNEIISNYTGEYILNINNTLKNDLGLDSLIIVDVLIQIEETFGIEFDESDLELQNLKTVKDLIQLVEKKL